MLLNIKTNNIIIDFLLTKNKTLTTFCFVFFQRTTLNNMLRVHDVEAVMDCKEIEQSFQALIELLRSLAASMLETWPTSQLNSLKGASLLMKLVEYWKQILRRK